jgi:F-type H+-transporting ATPase subunit epsilon
MADTLSFEIVTPTGVALSRQVSSVTAPTLDGEIGVLPGHIPLLTAVRTGLVSIKPVGEAKAGGDKGGDDELRYAVAHGVFQVAGERALLMSERFATREGVDIVSTRARLKEVDEALATYSGELDDPKRIELIEEEQWLGTLLELIGDPPPPTVREMTRFVSKQAEPHVVHTHEHAPDAEVAKDGGDEG